MREMIEGLWNFLLGFHLTRIMVYDKRNYIMHDSHYGESFGRQENI